MQIILYHFYAYFKLVHWLRTTKDIQLLLDKFNVPPILNTSYTIAFNVQLYIIKQARTVTYISHRESFAPFSYYITPLNARTEYSLLLLQSPIRICPHLTWTDVDIPVCILKPTVTIRTSTAAAAAFSSELLHGLALLHVACARALPTDHVPTY